MAWADKSSTSGPFGSDAVLTFLVELRLHRCEFERHDVLAWITLLRGGDDETTAKVESRVDADPSEADVLDNRFRGEAEFFGLEQVCQTHA